MLGLLVPLLRVPGVVGHPLGPSFAGRRRSAIWFAENSDISRCIQDIWKLVPVCLFCSFCSFGVLPHL